jgi:hypothetical protein
MIVGPFGSARLESLERRGRNMDETDGEHIAGPSAGDPGAAQTQIGRPYEPEAVDRPDGLVLLALLSCFIGFVLVVVGATAIATVPARATVCLVVGIAEFAFAYGAWDVKPWAWWLGIGLQIVVSILELAAVGVDAAGSIVVSGIILFYLSRRHVQKAFGRS